MSTYISDLSETKLDALAEDIAMYWKTVSNMSNIHSYLTEDSFTGYPSPLEYAKHFLKDIAKSEKLTVESLKEGLVLSGLKAIRDRHFP
jgi:hypothetical protein